MAKPLWPEKSDFCFSLYLFFYFFCTRALERVQIIHTFFPSIFFSVFFGTHALVLCPYVIILVDEWAGG